jgi:hypothetical protein
MISVIPTELIWFAVILSSIMACFLAASASE